MTSLDKGIIKLIPNNHKKLYVVPGNCENRECPFWNPNSEEHCGKPDPQTEEWIKKYCDVQFANKPLYPTPNID